MLTDAHLHLVDLAARDPLFPEALAQALRGRARAAPPAASGAPLWLGCAASHAGAEFEESEALRARLSGLGLASLASFGIHPQAVAAGEAGLLAELAASERIDAIGEAGFDFFGDRPELVRGPGSEAAQRGAFELQLELAIGRGLPLLLHVRKAMDLVFAYAPRLRRLPAAVFHSYSGTAREAEALLARGIEAYFSFGAAVLNGHRRAQEACARLPRERLLAETDAPWQPPRGEAYCRPEAGLAVVAAMARLRGEGLIELESALEANFRRAFGAGRRGA